MRRISVLVMLTLMIVVAIPSQHVSAGNRQQRRMLRQPCYQPQTTMVPCFVCQSDCICVLYSLSFMGMSNSWFAQRCATGVDQMLDGTYTPTSPTCQTCISGGYVCSSASCQPISLMSTVTSVSTYTGAGPAPTTGPGAPANYYHQSGVKLNNLLKYADHLPSTGTARNNSYQAVDKHYDGTNETIFLVDFTINGNAYTARLFDVTLSDNSGTTTTYHNEFHIGREFDPKTLPNGPAAANVKVQKVTINPNAIKLQYDGAVTWIPFQDPDTGVTCTYQVVMTKAF